MKSERAREDRLMGLPEVAGRLGLHYMTVYRHVRLGNVLARQEGNRWLVREKDLAAFERDARTPKPAPGSRDWLRLRRLLERRSLAGDVPGAWTVVKEALGNGASPVDVYVDLLAPVLRSIGSRWAKGTVTVESEHRATAVALRLVGRMGPSFARRGTPLAGTVLMGGAPGDHHHLPVTMVADVLRFAHLRVIDLGADAPESSFAREAAATGDLKVVGVSVSVDSSLERAASVLAALRASRPGVLLLVGGPAVTSRGTAHELGADDWARDARATAKLVASHAPTIRSG